MKTCKLEKHFEKNVKANIEIYTLESFNLFLKNASLKVIAC